ncbi:uncharacterized protein LOC124166921 [Ischnura elegans]|uniref:uncharacterized protein LOC124166918 n=1 Tax=Ischnura elegans TaxID=197161 RepID=UPI001ED8B467|nr:uncharacterized protein LOC124166918 [Ischnura elegans]XP_046400591.1 uncharacterized protein LOC124166921 [Ischnura elegans]
MVVNAKVFLLVGILAIGINFFPSERGLTDAAPVKDPAITPAHHDNFEGMAEGTIEEARGVYEEDFNEENGYDDRDARGPDGEDETGLGAIDTDDESNDRGAPDAGGNYKLKRKGRQTQINVRN